MDDQGKKVHTRHDRGGIGPERGRGEPPPLDQTERGRQNRTSQPLSKLKLVSKEGHWKKGAIRLKGGGAKMEEQDLDIITYHVKRSGS